MAKKYDLDGEMLTIAEMARRAGVTWVTMQRRLEYCDMTPRQAIGYERIGSYKLMGEPTCIDDIGKTLLCDYRIMYRRAKQYRTTVQTEIDVETVSAIMRGTLERKHGWIPEALMDGKPGERMSMGKYQALARRTQNKGLRNHQRLLHALHGMASEVGEIHAIYQKAYQGHTVDPDMVIEEIGDLLWFIAEMCDVLGVSLEDVARRNIDKLIARYPDGFSAERSLHRDAEAGPETEGA